MKKKWIIILCCSILVIFSNCDLYETQIDNISYTVDKGNKIFFEDLYLKYIIANLTGCEIDPLLTKEELTWEYLENYQLYEADAESIIELNANGEPISSLFSSSYRISDLTGANHLINLSCMQVRSNNISDLSPLSNLVNLQMLHLDENNSIEDISALSNLVNLNRLGLINCGLTDDGILSLTKLINLNTLWINDNSDLTRLPNMSDLLQLNYLDAVNNTLLSDISGLPALTEYNTLNFSGCNISDISILSLLTTINNLDFSSNNISDISALSSLVSVEHLWLGNNHITNISSLSSLQSINQLYLNNNNISDNENNRTVLRGLLTNGILEAGNTVDLSGNPAIETMSSEMESLLQDLIDAGINVSPQP